MRILHISVLALLAIAFSPAVGVSQGRELECTDTASLADGDVGETCLGGRCNGTVDSGCTYCSYDGSGSGSSWSRCDGSDPDYEWVSCTAWASNFCYVG